MAPIWHDRFARMLFRDLPRDLDGVVLDVHCGTGRTTEGVLQRTHESVRVVGLEPSPAMLALAQSRVRPQWRERVYFKEGDVADVAAMASDTYGLVLANLLLGDTPDVVPLVQELVRVTKPGGEVRATLPLRGSWAEVEDLLYEVLLRRDAGDAVRRLSRLARLRPTGAGLVERVVEAGIPPEHVVLDQDRFTLLFPSGREFLFAPSIEHGPLRLWKAIIGKGNEPQRVFWHLKEAIDTYFAGHVFAVTIVAGCLRVQAPGGLGAPLVRRYWQRYPELDRIFSGAAADADEDDLELDIDLDEDEEEKPAQPAQDEGESFADVGLALGLAGAGGGEAQSSSDDDEAVFAALEELQEPDSEEPTILGDVEDVFADLEQEARDEEAQARASSPPPRKVPPPPPTGPRKHLAGVHEPGQGTRRVRSGRRGPPPPPPPKRKK